VCGGDTGYASPATPMTQPPERAPRPACGECARLGPTQGGYGAYDLRQGGNKLGWMMRPTDEACDEWEPRQ